MQTKVAGPSQMLKLETEMGKKEYISLAENVLKEMNKQI
jgi:hypothetical protein